MSDYIYYDSLTGGTFRSNKETIDKVISKFNSENESKDQLEFSDLERAIIIFGRPNLSSSHNG